jgi:Fanconi anemia group M protein
MEKEQIDEFIIGLKLKDKIEARPYQVEIAANVLSKGNSLVVMPTALGKSYVALLITAEKAVNGGRVLFLAPTRPLVNQHFKLVSEILPYTSSIITGEIPAGSRVYSTQIIFATPQVVRNDLKSGRVDINSFSLIVFDEVHRAIGDYAYSFIAEKAKNTRALLVGFTASPSSERRKIEEICSKLGIENIDIRTESDEEVREYVNEIETEWEFIPLPEWLKKLDDEIKIIFQKVCEPLGLKNPSKRQLLAIRGAAISHLHHNPHGFKTLTTVARAINVLHAGELLETQGLKTTLDFFNGLGEKKSKAARDLLKDDDFSKIISEVDLLIKEGKEHPKFEKLMELVKEEISKKHSLIIFAQYRSTVKQIVALLEAGGVEAKQLIGRSNAGMKQKEQVDLIREFKNGEFSVLVCTSIGEEGLSIAEVDMVIFFEAVPSEIRLIQRRGRTGRVRAGRMVALVSKNTRDEAYFWASRNKEKKMQRLLLRMKKKKEVEPSEPRVQPQEIKAKSVKVEKPESGKFEKKKVSLTDWT